MPWLAPLRTRACRRLPGGCFSVSAFRLHWKDGFFAAPGWVVTCAHVVQDAAQVRVVPAGTPEGDRLWEVVARSGPPGRAGGLWPYPDLAVLHQEDAVGHPCVLLEGT